MPGGLDRVTGEALALGHLRQAAVLGLRVLAVDLGVPALLVRVEEALERDDRARGAELREAAVLRGGREPQRGGVALGIGHLRGHGALPDQLVQAELVRAQLGLDLGRGPEGVPRGPDGLVGLLRGLVALGVDARLGRHGVRPVELGSLAPGGLHGLLREVHRVRAHVRDVAVLVQALGHLHGDAGAHAELAGGLLLQRGGGEGGGRAAGVRLVLHRVDREVRPAQTLGQRAGAGLVQVGHLLAGGGLEPPGVVEVAARGHALAVHRAEAGRERAAHGVRGLRALGHREGALHAPVVGGDEGHALPLALDDEAGGHRLHAARREPAGDLAPEHRRELVAEQAVEDAARLLGVHEGRVQLTDVLQTAAHALLGDLAEGHAVHRHRGLEGVQQVPGDGLALAVRIRGEVEGLGVLELALELGDLLLLVRVHHVVRGEAVLRVHGELAEGALLHVRGQVRGLGQVTDVPHGGVHHPALAHRVEVLRDGLALGRGLHDDELLALGHRGGHGSGGGGQGGSSSDGESCGPGPGRGLPRRPWAERPHIVGGAWPTITGGVGRALSGAQDERSARRRAAAADRPV